MPLDRARLRGSGERASRRECRFPRYFTSAGSDPFDAIEWERRDAKITGERGEVVFEQTDIEVPASWSQLATNVVASKYFRGHLGTPERESSVKQLIVRVVNRIREWGEKTGYFRTPEDAQTFVDELKYVLATQRMAFNSPVWFNLGVAGHAAAGQCVLHQLRGRHHGVHHGSGEDRGDALQGRVRHRLESLEDPLLEGAPRGAAAPPPARCPS